MQEPLVLLRSTEASQAGLTRGQTPSWSPQEAVSVQAALVLA